MHHDLPPIDWSELGIEIPYGRTSGEVKTTCPRCSADRKKHHEKCLRVNLDKNTWYCHHCSWEGPEPGFGRQRGVVPEGGAGGYGRSHRLPPRPSRDREQKKVYQKPKPIEPIPQQSRMAAFFAQRGISPETYNAFGVVQDRASICFPYHRDGELVNVKHRGPEKKFWMEAGAELIFYNLDRVTDTDTVIIVEGELDVLALAESGITNVISPPNGAPALNADIEKADFSYLPSGEAVLNRARKVILAGDTDEPGRRLMDELARRIGRGKCWRVTWPEGCKDANDTLLSDGWQGGAEGVRVALEMAEPYPVDGIKQPADYLDALWKYEHDTDAGARITCWPHFADLCRFTPGQLTVLTGVPSSGKALALDTPIPTPTGWTTMGELRPGDRVLDEHGRPCNVVGVTPVWEGRPTYRVGFSDGTAIIADTDHEWLTSARSDRLSAMRARKNGRVNGGEVKARGTDQSHLRTYPSVKTTREIAQTLTAERGRRANHQIPATAPLALPDADLPIPPYTLGAWLGDGSGTHGMITCKDEAIIEAIRADGYTVTKQPAGLYRHSIWGLIGQLREVGLLGNKHIPASYLRASEAQRWALLQGLMDTDGYATHHCTSEFTTTNRALADGMLELVRSLGGIPTMSEGRAAVNGKDCGVKYRVRFHLGPDTYRLERKRERCRVQTRFRQGWVRSIASCDPVDPAPTVCIQVDSPSHLFLAGEAMVPTHNSLWLNQVLLDLSLKHGWNVGIFSPEYFPPDLHVRDLVENVLNKPMNHKFAGHDAYTVASRDEVRETVAEINEHIHLILPPEPTLDAVMERAQTLVYREGIKLLIIDPWTEIDQSERGNMSMTDWVDHCLKKLRRFGREFLVHVVIAAHPKKMQMEVDREGTRKMPVVTPYDIAECYSADTEVLTDQGWFTHAEMPEGSSVLAFDPETATLSWQLPTLWHEYDFDGELYHFKSKSTDVLVTPNHRMVVKGAWEPEAPWRFERADEIGGRCVVSPFATPSVNDTWDIRTVPLDGGYAGDDLIEFIGWWLAEGGAEMGGLTLSQSEGPDADRIIDLADRMGLDYHLAWHENGEHRRSMKLRVRARSHPELCRFVPGHCGATIDTKQLPGLAWRASQRQQRILLDTLIDGDGHRTPRRPGTAAYSTISRQLADDIQRLAIELGHPASVSSLGRAKTHHRDRYVVNIGRRDRREITLRRHRHITQVPYTGKVYCLTVPGGAYVTRRNGKMAIQGNSRHWFEMADICLSIWRDKKDPEAPVEIHVQKVRFRDNGDLGVALFKFDRVTRRYYDVTNLHDPDNHPLEA